MTNENFKFGFIAVVGRPNVGKSTLINALLNQKIAAVSPRPQTTRRRQLGILTLENAQMIFVDAPGIHKPKNKLGEFLNEEAEEALQGVDAILWMVDSSAAPTEDDARVASLLAEPARKIPTFLLLNKSDLLSPEAEPLRAQEFSALLPTERIMKVSAANRRGLGELIERLIETLPVRPPEYPEEQITDLYEREIAADLIREACLLQLRDEVPHSVAVKVEEFKERENGAAYVAATLFVEKESHKGIVIGAGGKTLKSIGSAARKEIEEMSGRKVFLELRVKVSKNWRDNQAMLSQLGYIKRK